MRTSTFDELDLAIVDAVRCAPRASWRELAPVLGVDAATISRRWSRMREEGVAWVTAHPAGSATPACALVEIVCLPGRSGEVADVLAADVQAATVKVTAGARDLLVLAQAPDLYRLSAYLLERVGRVPGITRVRSHLVTGSALDASRWREGALSPEQRRRLGAEAEAEARTGRGAVLEAPDHRIVRALADDGRMPLRRIAERVGLGPVAVRRRLTRLQKTGLITFRCDISRLLSGRPVAAVLFGSLQAHDMDSVQGRIRRFSGVRSCSLVAGPHNVVVDALLHTTEEAHDLERSMSRELPSLRFQDRSVVLYTKKLLGRVLDEEGRSVRAVPLVADDLPEHQEALHERRRAAALQ
ncbi:Lrp/AsnC family transcriptional regulator [Streptomyces thermoalcalitolerans]|uniref:AsnC family transcriptional regulator n=1 Tax=Streptomyces thermoalcalitolerans TaxID=65605 RepID=A0ABN1P6U1_9ACTN